MSDERFVTILSIDGGGIRGIIPALLLQEIERRTGRKTAEMFNLMAGTSTGGILALGLTMPDPATGKPKLNASDIVDLYRTQGPTIFPKPGFFRNIIDKVFGPKYPETGIDSVLKSRFGDSQLKDAVTDVMLTSYDIEARETFFFKSWKAKEDPTYNFPMWQAARGTSAAPTYFPPARVQSLAGGPIRTLVDGGVFANNPTMTAFAEANRLHPPEEVKYVVVSLGTGDYTRPYPYAKASRWGLIEWAVPTIDIMFDGVSMSIDYEMQKLLGEFKDPLRYYRLQGRLDQADDDMDNTSAENIELLEALSQRIIDENNEKLDSLAKWLAKGEAASPGKLSTATPASVH